MKESSTASYYRLLVGEFNSAAATFSSLADPVEKRATSEEKKNRKLKTQTAPKRSKTNNLAHHTAYSKQSIYRGKVRQSPSTLKRALNSHNKGIGVSSNNHVIPPGYPRLYTT